MRNHTEYYHLKALKEGNRESFRWVYHQFHEIIYYYCLKFIRQEVLAEEATIDVFIKLWEKRQIIDTECTIKPFLFKIAKDTAYNYLKKIASNNKLKKQFLKNYPFADYMDGELIFIERENLNNVENIIDALPPKRKQIFKMRYYEGKDNRTIAQQLHISTNTVKVHLVKARHYLKQQLNPHEYLYIVWLSIFL